MKNLALIIAVVAVLAGGAYAFHVARPSAQPVGASGSTFSQRVFFFDNQVVGGYDFATTSQGTVTYPAASFAAARTIEHNASGATTANLPTAASLSSVGFLPNVGDSQTILIHASTTKVTLAGNTGLTLATASSTTAVSAGSLGRLECVRLGATEGKNIWCLLTAD